MYHKYGNDYYKTISRIVKQLKCNMVTTAEYTHYISKTADCKNESSKLYGLLIELLCKSNDKNPLSIRSSEFQLANDSSEYFLLRVKCIVDMFKTIPLSKSQFIPEFPNLSPTNFSEMNHEETLYIIRIVNKTSCANDPFKIRKMSFGIFSGPISFIYWYSEQFVFHWFIS